MNEGDLGDGRVLGDLPDVRAHFASLCRWVERELILGNQAVLNHSANGVRCAMECLGPKTLYARI